MSNNYFELGLTPPHGVAFIQWADGSIRIRYQTNNVVPLRDLFLGLAKQLREQAIVKLEQERQSELERQRMPLSRLESINHELQSLKTATESDESTEPGVIIGKVVQDVTD